MSSLAGINRPRPAMVVAGLLAVAILVTVCAAGIDPDSTKDLVRLYRSIDIGVTGLRWQFAIAVVALTGLHYVATAVAARAAATTPLRFGETVLAQLAAATANRIAPGGIGGAAVNARYFTCRGMDGRGAIGAVAVLTVLGAIADLIAFFLIVSVGRLFGLGGGGGELQTLSAEFARLGRDGRSAWLLPAVGALVVAGAVYLRRRRRRPGAGPRGRFFAPFSSIARRPRSLAALMTASGATTLILGFAFVATNSMLPGPQPQASVGALLVAYMAASALGNAVPIPSGLGSTETAMVAVLVAAHVPAAHALGVVLTYRLITFWLPAAAGLAAGWHLRRSGAL
jgi:uncharacterized membrane protein YbhN (UPF0104 family)